MQNTLNELKEELLNTLTFTLDYDMDDLNLISKKESETVHAVSNEIKALSHQVNNYQNEGTHLMEELIIAEKENQPLHPSLAERIIQFCNQVKQYSQNIRWKLIKFLYAEEETEWG